MSIACARYLQILLVCLRVVAYYEETCRDLIAIGVRGDDHNLVGAFVQPSICCESALVVDVDELALDTDDRVFEGDSNDGDVRHGERHLDVVLGGIDDAHKQPLAHHGRIPVSLRKRGHCHRRHKGEADEHAANPITHSYFLLA